MESTAGLLERARGGDQTAFEALFRHVTDRVLLFAEMRLGPQLRGQLEPMDLLQAAYVIAWRDLARFEHRGEGSFARWICRLVENQIRDQADHFAARKRSPPGGRLKPLSDVVDQARAARTGPATAAGRLQARQRLAAAMQQLDEPLRVALLMRYFEDRTLAEIAELLVLTPSAARRLVGQAMERLSVLIAGAADG